MCYGQSNFSVRTLAYEMAQINDIEIPESWRIENRLAWSSFMDFSKTIQMFL